MISEMKAEGKVVEFPATMDIENLNSEIESDIDRENEEEIRIKRRNSRAKKIIFGLLLLAFVIYVIVDSLTTGYIRTAIQTFLKWIEANPVPGVFIFVVVYLVATVLFVPGSILTLGAGFVFANAFGLGIGVLLGTLSVFFGASAGAIIAFLFGRYLFRDSVKALTKKYAIFEALDAALEEKGFRIMALLRLSPIIPFNAINYIAGVTAISFKDYVLTMLAILPGTVLYIFLGASAGSLADSASSGDNITVIIIVVVVGIVFGIAAIAATSYYAKKKLNRVLAARETSVEEGEECQPNDDTMVGNGEEKAADYFVGQRQSDDSGDEQSIEI